MQRFFARRLPTDNVDTKPKPPSFILPEPTRQLQQFVQTVLPKPVEACQVCHAPSIGNNYGVLTCEGCGQFFRFSKNRESAYKCRKTNSCLITVETRNNCKRCRFDACLRAGMKPYVVSKQSSSPCPVCGYHESGEHYGGQCCNLCAFFFCNYIRRGSAPICNRDNSCVITVETRRKCRACRFKACLKAGMKPGCLQMNQVPEEKKMEDDINTDTVNQRMQEHPIATNENREYYGDGYQVVGQQYLPSPEAVIAPLVSTPTGIKPYIAPKTSSPPCQVCGYYKSGWHYGGQCCLACAAEKIGIKADHIREEQMIDAEQYKDDICQICGDHKSSDGPSCSACLGFFRFSKKSDSYICEGTNSCVITVDTRSECDKCRFDACLRAGMKPLTPPIEPCEVCRAPSTGFHYGVLTCEGCKAFFRRVISGESEYVCKRGGACMIDIENCGRKKCKACRLDKCLKVGMQKDSVKVARKTEIQQKEDTICTLVIDLFDKHIAPRVTNAHDAIRQGNKYLNSPMLPDVQSSVMEHWRVQIIEHIFCLRSAFIKMDDDIFVDNIDFQPMIKSWRRGQNSTVLPRKLVALLCASLVTKFYAKISNSNDDAIMIYETFLMQLKEKFSLYSMAQYDYKTLVGKIEKIVDDC